MITPTLIVHAIFKDESLGYYTLDWGARLVYDDRGWLSIEDAPRSASVVIGHASNIRELKIMPPTRPAVQVEPRWPLPENDPLKRA